MGLEIETEVEEGDVMPDFDLLEVEGRYKLGIDAIDDSKEDKVGCPMGRLSLVVLEGPQAGATSMFVSFVTKEQVQYAKKQAEADPSDEDAVKAYKSLRRKFSNMVRLLTAVGLYDGGGSLKFNTDDLVGREFDADVTVRKYMKDGDAEGSPTGRSNNVKLVLDGAPAATPAEEAPETTTGAEAAPEGDAAAEAEAAAAAAEAEAAAAAEAEAAAAAAAKPKPGLKKPLVKPPLKPVPKPAARVAPKAPGRVAPKAPAKHSFARR